MVIETEMFESRNTNVLGMVTKKEKLISFNIDFILI
jgi:hypothetical protein